MAAEHNLAFDWDGYRQEMEQHGDRVGRRAEGRAVQARPARRAQEGACTAAEFLGYDALEVDGAKVIGIIASDQLCDQVDEVDHEHPIVVVLDKTPFYGEMGGQVGDTGELVGRRLPLRGDRHAGRRRLHAPPSATCARARSRWATTVTARVDADAAAGHPPGPLGHAPAALRPAKAPRQARPAAGLEGRRRLCCGSTSPTPTAVARRAAWPQIEDEVNARVLDGDAGRLRRTCRWPTPARPAR